MDDGAPHAAQGVEGLLNQVLARLHQDLHGHVLGDLVLVDQHPAEVEIRARRGGEADFDLLESQRHEGVEERALARRIIGSINA